jgi:ABC-type branched-subunit amino acid transport system substrate-binding protein
VALTGNLSETSFTDLIQFYNMSRQTAAVRIVSPAGPEHDGILYIENGEVVDAQFGELSGVEAVRRALRLKDGVFHVELNVRAPRRTVFEPWSRIVLEEMVSDDEALASEAAGLAPPIGPDDPLGSLDDDEDEEEPMRLASESMSGPRHCPVCHRRYLAGTTCTDDGAQLVAGSPPNGAGRSHPPPIPKTQPTPLEKTMPPPPQSKTGLYIIAGVVVLALAGFAVWKLSESRARAEKDDAERVASQAKAAAAAQAAANRPQGVSDTEITFGMSAPFSGPAKELGRAMKTGIDIAFSSVNEAGGINGRKLRLIALDDGYEPDRTKVTMKELADNRKVFGFIGNVGTPTAEVAVPFILERKMLFFAPFTGAGLLRRDPPDRYVFNYRASYAEETAAIMKYLVEVKRIKPEEIAVFAQQDGYGESGWSGVAKMLRKYDRDPEKTLRTGYKRNTAEVQDAVNAVLGNRTRLRAVVMVPAYKAAAKFVDKVKAERPDMIFTSVSFVGSQALADELMSYGAKVAEGVIVTQVVPLPTSKSTAVLRYQELLPKYSLGEKPDFVSLEGYIAASLLLEGLKRAGPEFTTETLIDTLEGMKNIDLGIGAPLSFGLSEHQASHKVWGTVLEATGQYQTLDLE